MRNPEDVALAIAFGASCTDISEETEVWIPYREEIASLIDERLGHKDNHGIRRGFKHNGAAKKE